MKITETLVLFWGGPFSQWYDADMMIDGNPYNCAEQWMMACKAIHFKDHDSLVKIMKTGEPSRQKSLGRMVKGFVPAEWDAVSRDYVTKGNMAKFSQHDDLKAILLGTGDKEIVEASPYDRLWGIGLGMDDPRSLDKTQWQGKNWLGECIMRVRTELRK
jgi:ribA/ribD-fused uncharacterized protein